MIKTDLNILYEDNHLLVVIKPEGILSQADSTEDQDMLTLIKEYLIEKYNKPGDAFVGLVHRLDQRVSGVMVFAKTSKAASRLSEQIRENSFKKTYYAVVQGTIDSRGQLKNFIKKELVDNKYYAVIKKEGDLALLNYNTKTTARIDGNIYSMIEVDLITGRYNQIRAQFAYLGYPLLNDYKYHYSGHTKYSDFGLLAYKIEFVHPTTKENLKFSHFPSTGVWTEFESN